MKKLFMASFLAVSLCSVAAFAEEMTGYISDSNCGAQHSSPSAANTKCLQGCMKKGADPVLVSNGKVMKFDDESKAKAKAFLGDNVKIDGSMEGDTVKISSIEKAE
jgi:hypothetical protein